jgi:type IV pilus assembly protein PilB
MDNCKKKYILEKTIYPELVNKIKILSKLQIAEKRLPQDGRMDFKLPAITLDIRVSILPTLYGEKIVLRLLGTNAENIHFSDLGMNNDEKKQYLKGVDKSNGIILISGPTGSGKTTTLYATLNYLNNVTRNIVTIEDPIEYTLEGINQVQLKDQIGLSFPNALKSFLRQDPDIIMVGEIRDKETADMAIRASLTGHLVLSTIHTNSAKGTISRLIDMGIPPFLIADTLKLSMAQRLVRLLCNECKVEVQLDKSLIPQSYNVIDFEKVYESNGCPNCFYTGYKGRTAIFEIIYIDNELEDSIKKNMLNESLLKLKHITLGEKCLALLKQGKTTLKEIYPMLTNT